MKFPTLLLLGLFSVVHVFAIEVSHGILEQFDSEDGWVVSHGEKNGQKYSGRWAFEESYVNPGIEGDKGLVAKSEASLHAISRWFSQSFQIGEKDPFVLQYEVKFQQAIDCGGAYIKLFPVGSVAGESFTDLTPFVLSFGPDKCGDDNKVGLVIRRHNLATGDYEVKSLKTPPLAKLSQLSNLYSLIIEPDNSFEIRINGRVALKGGLYQLFDLEPPKTIQDPNDTKPDTFDDRQFIPDPENLEKPADYQDDQPFKIADPDAKIPTDWKEDEPLYISDPAAVKPDEWDDAEDGVWTAPWILNPRCRNRKCGKWEPPMVPNPSYKGKWFPPTVVNPNYMGVWEPKTIPNPHYYHDVNASRIEPIGGMGFEIWTMTPDILFDNIYLGSSISEAEKIGNATFVPKQALERRRASETKAYVKHEPETPPTGETKSSNSIKYWVYLYLEFSVGFLNDFLADPVKIILTRPGELVFYCTIFVAVFTFVFGTFSAVLFVLTGGSVESHGHLASEVAPDVSVEESVGQEVSGGTIRKATGTKGTVSQARKRRQ